MVDFTAASKSLYCIFPINEILKTSLQNIEIQPADGICGINVYCALELFYDAIQLIVFGDGPMIDDIYNVNTCFVGLYNVYNLLASLTVVKLLGIEENFSSIPVFFTIDLWLLNERLFFLYVLWRPKYQRPGTRKVHCFLRTSPALIACENKFSPIR